MTNLEKKAAEKSLIISQSREQALIALADAADGLHRELRAAHAHPTRANIASAQRALYGCQRIVGLLSEATP